MSIVKTTDVVGAAYSWLLDIPITDNFRALNQDIYARLRDYIAQETGRDAQAVQEEYEEASRD